MKKLLIQEAIQLNQEGYPIRWRRLYNDDSVDEVWTVKIGTRWEVYKKNLSTNQVYCRTNADPEVWELTAVTASVSMKDPRREILDAAEVKIDISKKEFDGDPGETMDQIIDGWRK